MIDFNIDGNYKKWIQKNELPHDELKKELGSRNLKTSPLISIVTPVFNPPHSIFLSTIKSVLEQVYENWEFCIVNGSTDPEIKEILEKFSKSEPRIKIKHVQNEGISENTNKAISMTEGEFIVLFDHDDLLSPAALYEIAKIIDENDSIDFIYSDSDKISEEGIRFEPFFKPDWSPATMLSVNYVAHLCCFRKKLLESIGEFKKEVEGAQDWDVILRISEKCRQIYHIQKILYHWRVTQTSTASSMDTKPFASNSQIIAVTNHLKRKGANCYVIHEPSNYLHCKIQSEEPFVSIIIPLVNNSHNVDTIIQNTSYTNYEIVLVVNKENNISLDFKNSNRMKIIWHDFDNVSEAFNMGCSKSSGSAIVFLNSSMHPVHKLWLKELTNWLSFDEIGGIGSKVVDKKDMIKHEGIIYDKDGNPHYVFEGTKNDSGIWTMFGGMDWYRNYNSVSGYGMIIKKDLFEKFGKFKNDENFDKYFCLDLRKNGYQIMFTPFSVFIDGETKYVKNKLNLQDYDNIIKNGDSYYNQNLLIKDVRKFNEN